MKAAAALMLLFAPLAMAPAQSSVWKVTRDGGTVYLGARCHLLRPADFPLPAEFDAAYAAAEILVLETDLTHLQSPQAQQQIVALGQQGPAGSLRRDLSPEAFIVRRHRAWHQQIVALLQTPPVEFVIVDGAHLPGPNGLVAGILADGGTDEQIDVTPDPER